MEIRFGIITVSDRASQGTRSDRTGPVLMKIIEEKGWIIKQYKIVPDEIATLSNLLSSWADQGEMDVILTAGGTGLSPRDITPEATLKVIDRAASGTDQPVSKQKDRDRLIGVLCVPTRTRTWASASGGQRSIH